MTARKSKKRPSILPGQLDLFGAPQAANAPSPKPANDALAQMNPPEPAPFVAPSKPKAANANELVKRPRGRPRKTPPLACVSDTAAPRQKPHDVQTQAVRDEWWNSQMVCAFLKISRKTLWERRRAKDLNFPKPVLLGGVRNLYRSAAIKEWAERMADAEL